MAATSSSPTVSSARSAARRATSATTPWRPLRPGCGMRNAATIVAAIGAGTVGGVFFAFSAFVMPALDRVAPGRAIASMHSINDLAPRAPLMLPFLGTAALCGWLAVVAFRSWGSASATWLAVGCALYLLGPFLLTAV